MSCRRSHQDAAIRCENTDAYYCVCPIDPTRRYRISGNRGDTVYFSLTA